MEQLPMRVVARMTGLSSDTIRAWERRYGAVVPERTKGNTRRYSALDVKRLVLLRRLTENGHAISSVAQLDDGALESLIDDPVVSEPRRDSQSLDSVMRQACEDYLTCVTAMDARGSSAMLLKFATLLDGRDLVFQVVVPIMREIGRRWEAGQFGIAQEHLVSAQLNTLLSAFMKISNPDRGAERILLTTPSGHRHEFGIIVGGLLGAARGFEVVLLGPDLPDADILWAAEMSKADVVILGVSAALSDRETQRLVPFLEHLASRFEVWVGCPPGHVLATTTASFRHFTDFESLDLALAHRATKRSA